MTVGELIQSDDAHLDLSRHSTKMYLLASNRLREIKSGLIRSDVSYTIRCNTTDSVSVSTLLEDVPVLCGFDDVLILTQPITQKWEITAAILRVIFLKYFIKADCLWLCDIHKD